MIDQRAVDASRVYATGYSMGGMKSWTLGFERPDRFAAIAPTEGIPGMGKVSLPDPDRSIPTFWVAGEKEFYNLFPMNSEAAIAIIQQLANANGFAYNGIYDESLGKYYGMKTDKTYTYCPRPAHSDDEAVMTIHEMKSKDGMSIPFSHPCPRWVTAPILSPHSACGRSSGSSVGTATVLLP